MLKRKKNGNGQLSCYQSIMANPHSKHLFFLGIWLILISVGAGIYQAMEWPAMVKAKAEKVAMFKELKKDLPPKAYEKMIDELGDPNEDQIGSSYVYGRMWVLAYTIVTTIGYGAICPITPAGQFFTTVYTILTVPFSLYVFASVAEEILDWCTEYLLPNNAKSTAAFEKFDTDHNGTLDKTELHEALNEVGFKLNLDEMEEKWKIFDKDSNGLVDYDEFRAACKELHITKFGESDEQFKYRFIITLSIVHTVLGTIVFHFTEIAKKWTLLESFYFCIVTTTTVGLGDFVPSSTAGLIFLPVWSFLGLGIIAALLELIALSWFKVKDTYTYPHLSSLENGTDDETEKLL